MKNALVYLLLVSLLNSCKDQPQDMIVGKWQSFLKPDDPLNFAPNLETWRVVFYKDGTGTLETGKKDEELGHRESFTYKLIHDGKTINIAYESSFPARLKSLPEQWNIKKLSDTKLRLELMEGLEMDLRKLR